jgi:hypothetical protein
VRDAALTHLRTIAYEDAIDAARNEKLRTDLLEKLRSAGVTSAERILITDLVIQ